MRVSSPSRQSEVSTKVRVENCCYFSFSCPASMKQQEYHVWVKLKLDDEDVITQVVKASCECIAGENGLCHHVSTLLNIIEQLPSNLDETSPTSKPCYWKQPAARTAPKAITPISECNFHRGDADSIHRSKLARIATSLREKRRSDGTSADLSNAVASWKLRNRGSEGNSTSAAREPAQS